MKKFLIAASAITLFACGSDAADVTLYYMPGCPHCHNAINFFDSELKDVTVDKVDVTQGGKSMERFADALKKCNITSRGVPLMIVNGECIQGYSPDTNAKIKTMLGK